MPWVEFDKTWNERLHKRQYREHLRGSKALLRRDSAKEAVDSGHAHYCNAEGVKTEKGGKVVPDVRFLG